MTTTIDTAGRVVIPKRLRDAFNLGPGVEIDIETRADGLHLRPAGQGTRLVSKSGFLVHAGSGKVDLDVPGFIKRQREGRVAGIARQP
jgi:AbrB family looped-hinge helix DNA binding protein